MPAHGEQDGGLAATRTHSPPCSAWHHRPDTDPIDRRWHQCRTIRGSELGEGSRRPLDATAIVQDRPAPRLGAGWRSPAYDHQERCCPWYGGKAFAFPILTPQSRQETFCAQFGRRKSLWHQSRIEWLTLCCPRSWRSGCLIHPARSNHMPSSALPRRMAVDANAPGTAG